ncbi:hypothetical protein [Saccharopolyspora sp. ASAGF58]|uniref:hypothetical protein n=1 Tax=Saccharopolyspora sp. ASAGF58 TaxID=2719023 RepID=UPI00143FDA7B|nr:hypothetical protein [Saccharopolyspora sp. ASAGF58]QIZ34488.1 hypothetical protein FDZ84_06760 [Saccharopolyspora sp. ASAGF58]
MPLSKVAQPGAVRDWMEWLRADPRVSVNYQAQLFDVLSSILSGAVADKRVPENPCRTGSIRRPQPTPSKTVAWDAARVSAIASALPLRQRIAVPLGSGVGSHKDPGFTLRVYTHLLPSSHNRARAAIDDFTAQLTTNDQLAA